MKIIHTFPLKYILVYLFAYSILHKISDAKETVALLYTNSAQIMICETALYIRAA